MAGKYNTFSSFSHRNVSIDDDSEGVNEEVSWVYRDLVASWSLLRQI